MVAASDGAQSEFDCGKGRILGYTHLQIIELLEAKDDETPMSGQATSCKVTGKMEEPCGTLMANGAGECNKSKISDSTVTDSGESVRRRFSCMQCGAKWDQGETAPQPRRDGWQIPGNKDRLLARQCVESH